MLNSSANCETAGIKSLLYWIACPNLPLLWPCKKLMMEKQCKL